MYSAAHCMLRNTRYDLSQNLVNYLAGSGLQCDHSCKFIMGHSKKIWNLVLIESRSVKQANQLLFSSHSQFALRTWRARG